MVEQADAGASDRCARSVQIGTVAAMSTAATENVARPRKAGRPPRISRAMIAQAANDLGLDGLTLKAVADHLGVTVAALYHHVSGKDDLMRLAAERSARDIPLPVDEGQHWAQWLRDWAKYNLDVFTAEPGLLAQYLEGGIGPEFVVENLDVILAVLVREGFSVADANAAYHLVASCALGTVVAERWEAAIAEQYGDVPSAFRRVVDAAPKHQLGQVRRLLRAKPTTRDQRFEQRIEVVLRGIAAKAGRRWRPVVSH